ncbi:MAG: hypothetical protein JRI25_14215 [Deltaproteobacteria bacterium]|nr:hypothetical protein [Deltaproteobacteria bacterium]MBW2255739.1 hypothetical protein [Deltaproteobacteria bacterium]
MARTLTVRHEESPQTNPLLTGFLVIAALVLLASAIGGMSGEGAVANADAPPPVVDAR